jgi:hypothetical protein
MKVGNLTWPRLCAKAQREEPKSEKEKLAIDFLRNDSQARVAFIHKVAPPVANKLFECRMIS